MGGVALTAGGIRRGLRKDPGHQHPAARGGVGNRSDAVGLGICYGFRKGVALIGPHYDEGERPCVDIDLYVEEADAGGTVEALAGMGYEGAILPGSTSVSLHGGRGVRVIVDVHWDLGFVGRCRRDWRSVLGDPLADGGHLTPEAFAADLVGHLWHHSFRGLLRYLDFAVLIKVGRLTRRG